MFEFLKNLFNKVTPLKEGEPVYINITDKNIVVNQNNITLPCSIDRITAILGQPRAQRYETKPEDKEMLRKMHPNEKVTDRTNYMWDNLGIKCYTLDGQTVNTFGIELNKGVLDYPNVPSNMFGGTVTINGRPWLQAIKLGDDEMVLQKLKLGKFSLCAEYVDIDQDMNDRTERDYTGIEIGLK
ncbi:MAG: hypothetical protein K2N36_08075 [Ruminiclostridium sp.]|nr:hypothetical protein [Ruminiclostridium sp.]